MNTKYEKLLKFLASKPIKDVIPVSNADAGDIVRLSCGSNAVMALITNNDKKENYIRVSPLAISPFPQEIDSTDIVVPASQMPNELTSLIEWWNDRPVMRNQIDYVFGELDNIIFSKVLGLIEQQPQIENPTEDIIIFRESEKAKGNVVSAVFYEEFFNEDSAEVNSLWPDSIENINENVLSCQAIIPFVINYEDICSANESLAMSATSKSMYQAIKVYLEKTTDEYIANQVENSKSDSFTIRSKDKSIFRLVLTKKDNSIAEYKSNTKGKLYLKDGLPEFIKIEFIKEK